MAKINEQIDAELENIERVMAELPESGSLSSLSSLELAGVATLTHNFYNGIENILKKLILYKNMDVPHSHSWHKDLVNIALSNNIISSVTAKKLREYLGFRQFFNHSYSFDLDAERMTPLIKNISSTLTSFRNDISKILG